MMSKKVSGFLMIAERELAAARCLYNNEFDAEAMYLVAQSAEKAARAVLESGGLLVGTTHSFDQLGSKLDTDHPLRDRILDFDEMLSGASTRYRYPTESGSVRVPRQSDVEFYLDEVESFIGAVKQHITGAEFNSFKR
jgi:HEPN domain-containing protein